MKLLDDEEIRARINTIHDIPFFEADDFYLCKDIAQNQLSACKMQVALLEEEIQSFMWDYLGYMDRGYVGDVAKKIIETINE